MAALLSSLRTFAHLINAQKMDQSSQNSVLWLLHTMTRFPPAFRAVYILMEGKCLSASECTALGQTVYEILTDMIPREVIKNDATRVFEGSRLLFGFILDKAQQVRRLSELPDYHQSFRTLDIRDIETLEPILHPVQTAFGLSEQEYHNAHLEGGILYRSGGRQRPASTTPPSGTMRMAIQYGGLKGEIVHFDLDNLNAHRRPEDIHDPGGDIGLYDLPNLFSLAALCEPNGLAVAAPAALPSSTAPALTLDRDGLMAVYVGRAPCAVPGQE